MGTNEQVMAWMMDTYSMQRGYAVPEVVTGKPLAIGGSVYRREATGVGVVLVLEHACAKLGVELAAQRCVIQGFGSVGRVVADELELRGCRIIALSDLSGALYEETGFDLHALDAHVAEHGSLAGFARATQISNEQLLELPCDVLVLAACEDQVTAENAPRLRARILAEGANGPITNEADAMLATRGVVVLPDVLASAGGVTVSYFEWVQDIGHLFWDREMVRARLVQKLGEAVERIWSLAEELNISLRRASLVAAIREVAGALDARGLYP
jgi:glutamate dehydrogenase (NAD(P)+)